MACERVEFSKKTHGDGAGIVRKLDANSQAHSGYLRVVRAIKTFWRDLETSKRHCGVRATAEEIREGLLCPPFCTPTKIFERVWDNMRKNCRVSLRVGEHLRASGIR
jgi:hypothetical protein